MKYGNALGNTLDKVNIRKYFILLDTGKKGRKNHSKSR